jgi:exopolysaccharide biosynthesis WecB/TagA/CpsF family protein
MTATVTAEKPANFPRRYPVAGILASATTYAEATACIIEAARMGRSMLVAATSVHGVALGNIDHEFGGKLNAFDVLTPDGQPVRWALNWLHGAGLADRVYGPWLMLHVCEAAAREGLKVYLYGARPQALKRLVERLPKMVPGLQLAGSYSPPFRLTSLEEDAASLQRIIDSGADILFVGISTPRQETWAHRNRAGLAMPIVCVGAAFDLHAGMVKMAPRWMQDRGLEWLFRVTHEPRRLGRRYATYPPVFVLMVARQYIAERVLSRPSDYIGRRGVTR